MILQSNCSGQRASRPRLKLRGIPGFFSHGHGLFALSPVVYFGALSAPFLTFTVAALFAGIGIVYWRRTDCILTPTAILFRALVGRPFEIPLTGVKRVSQVVVSDEGTDYLINRLEFVVGGFLDLPQYLTGGVLIRRVEQLVEAAGVRAEAGVRPTE